MDKDLLHKLYVVDELPLEVIATEIGSNKPLVVYYVRKYGFPRRNRPRIERKVGDQIGDWTLLRHLVKRNKGYWECQCACGTIKEIDVSSLNANGSKSCRSCAMAKTRDNKAVPSHYWLKLTYHAEKRKRKVEITREYAENLLVGQKHRCALTGWDIGFGRGRTQSGKHSEGDTTASLDRIDPSKDYVKGNVQWVHKDINRMKQYFTEEKLLSMCEAVLKFAKEGKDVGSTKVSRIRKKHR